MSYDVKGMFCSISNAFSIVFFILFFLVQCVHAKAMSWSSMVEYRDLCKLFFKLKNKKWILHWKMSIHKQKQYVSVS